MSNLGGFSMSDRGTQLQQVADRQLSELLELFSTHGEDVLSLPCPGREKLGDGTVGTCASHTAENYLRIAAFLRGEEDSPSAHGERSHGPRRIPSFLRARGHRGGHSRGAHRAPSGRDGADRQRVLERLSAGRQALGVLGKLTDEQLAAAPAASEIKFCDGKRSLEQIVASVLNHQSHQVDALKAALA
ncbi:MAG: hypothetical protein ACRDK7_03075 [Solirubrobacteraceae bacterium]